MDVLVYSPRLKTNYVLTSDGRGLDMKDQVDSCTALHTCIS